MELDNKSSSTSITKRLTGWTRQCSMTDDYRGDCNGYRTPVSTRTTWIRTRDKDQLLCLSFSRPVESFTGIKAGLRSTESTLELCRRDPIAVAHLRHASLMIPAIKRARPLEEGRPADSSLPRSRWSRVALAGGLANSEQLSFLARSR